MRCSVVFAKVDVGRELGEAQPAALLADRPQHQRRACGGPGSRARAGRALARAARRQYSPHHGTVDPRYGTLRSRAGSGHAACPTGGPSHGATTATRPPGGRRCGTSGCLTASPMSWCRRRPTPTWSAAVRARRRDRAAGRHPLRWPQLGREPRARRRDAARRLPPRRGRDRPRREHRAVGPGREGRRALRHGSSARTSSSPPATAAASRSAATCSRAATAGTAACSGRRARACSASTSSPRGRARPRRRGRERGPLLVRTRRGPRLLRRRHPLPRRRRTTGPRRAARASTCTHSSDGRALHVGDAIGPEVDRRVEMQILMSGGVRAARHRPARDHDRVAGLRRLRG